MWCSVMRGGGWAWCTALTMVGGGAWKAEMLLRGKGDEGTDLFWVSLPQRYAHNNSLCYVRSMAEFGFTMMMMMVVMMVMTMHKCIVLPFVAPAPPRTLSTKFGTQHCLSSVSTKDVGYSTYQGTPHTNIRSPLTPLRRPYHSCPAARHLHGQQDEAVPRLAVPI